MVETAPSREEVVAEARVVEPVVAVAPSAPAAAEPKLDTRELLSGAGLEMVETKTAAVASAAAEADEAAKLGRPRRERPHEEAQELVQVETRK